MLEKIPIILFNLFEIICVYLLGLAFNIPKNFIIIIMLLFVLARYTFGKPLHYQSPYRCFIMTLLVFLSMFVVFDINVYVSILFTIFDAFILTGKGNIEDVFMWSGKKTQYQDIIDYIKFNPLNDKIKEFENKLQDQDNLSYLIYKYRFKDLLTFQEISDRLQIETNRITEIQDKVAFTFRIFLGI